MDSYCIVTDPSANLSAEFLKQNDIYYFDVPFVLNNKTYSAESSFPLSDFYAALRDGQEAYAPAPSQTRAEYFLRHLLTEKDQDIIIITVSSRLGYINSIMNLAADKLSVEFPHRRITVIDSLSASLGEGLLVDMAARFRASGFKYNENVTWLEKIKTHIIHCITVNDLNALSDNKKISPFISVLGTIFDLKLLFRIDALGSLVVSKTISYRMRSIESMVNSMASAVESEEYKRKNGTIYIAHGDCEADAIVLAKKIEERYGFTEFMIEPLTPVLGGYTGPGSLGVFFLGESR